MILTLDMGNTNIVLGGYVDNEIRFVSRIQTDTFRMEDQYAAEISSILNLYGIDHSEITGSIISSVVPPLTNTLAHAIEKLTGKTPLVVGPGIKTGLNIKIDNPGQLGADLVAGAVAANLKYPKPCVIFDLGTATKATVLDQDGNFLGGCIMPGIRISMDALSEKTAQLPDISLEAPKRVIGTNTIECMQSGIVFGNAAMIDGMVDRIELELGGKVTVIGTGGLSGEVLKNCARTIISDPNIILDGLNILYQKNNPTAN